MDLDQLQSECEKLLALLKDRQPGLMAWNQWLAARLRKIREITEEMDEQS